MSVMTRQPALARLIKKVCHFRYRQFTVFNKQKKEMPNVLHFFPHLQTNLYASGFGFLGKAQRVVQKHFL